MLEIMRKLFWRIVNFVSKPPSPDEIEKMLKNAQAAKDIQLQGRFDVGADPLGSCIIVVPGQDDACYRVRSSVCELIWSRTGHGATRYFTSGGVCPEKIPH